MAAIIIAFVAASYAISQGILLQGFARVEQEQTGTNVQRALSALGMEISNLDAIAHDWAAWDDSYAFMHDRNQEYLRANVVDSTFTRLRLNLMLYADTTGQVVFARGFDFNTEQEMPVSQGLQEYLAENGALLRFPNEESGVSGIIMLPEGPMLAASRPILTSQGEGPIRGTLLTGRYLDPQETRRIGDVTHLSLSLHQLTGSPLSPQLQAARSALLKGETTFVQAANEDIIGGYGLLQDINGNPALILKIEQPRDIYQQGVASAGYLILTITAVVLLSGVSVVFLVEKLVLSRLRQLNANVAGIGSSDTSARVSVAGNDEISSLAESINGMLERIEKSQAALRDSEERFRVAAESTSDLIWEWNVKGGTVLWFGDIDGILGYQPGEFPRTLEAWEKAIHPDDHDWVMEALQRGADGIAPYDVKYRVLRKDGSIHYWTDRGTATITDEDGHAQVMVGACSDVTARELAVDALQRSEERYRTVLDEMEDNYFEVDLAGNMTFANDATCRTLGYTHEELMEMNYRVFIAEEHRETLYHSFNTVYQTGKMLKGVSYDIVRKNGSRGTGEFAISLRRNERGETIGFRGIGRDITERKKAEEALRRSEQKYQELVEGASVGIGTADAHGLITFVNQTLRQALGYSEEEIEGKPVMDFVHPDDRPRMTRGFIDVVRDGKTRDDFEFRAIHKDGHAVHFQLGVTQLKEGEQTTGTISVLTDVTERVRAEEERKELEFKAQMASRLATVGEMAAGIAHEINNPLTGVIGYAQFLMQEELPDRVKKDVEMINEGAQRVAGIVKRLLAFARQTKPQRDFVNINDIISTTLDLRAYHLKTSNIKVTTQLDPDLPITVGDGGQLQQVFLNLIINAEAEMKAAHGKGKLLIKTEKTKDNIRISFKDDGPGIARENLEKIFNPFFTTRQVGEGTGLGLSICYGIVVEHGGKIWAESKPGKGAIFIVELPIVIEPEQLPMAEAPASEMPKVATARMLVVDDEATVRDLLRRALEEEGHEVECVDNAEDALELVQKKRYRLILLDIKMPGMSGPELYQRMNKITKSLARRVVFVTGDVIGTGTQEFLKKTKARYIAKPFDVVQMKKEINQILAEG